MCLPLNNIRYKLNCGVGRGGAGARGGMAGRWREPLKLYVQDVHRAQETSHKYVYQFCGMSCKNIALHGLVTEICSVIDSVVNFELTDPTGSVHIYFDSKKSNNAIDKSTVNSLCQEFDYLLTSGHPNLPILKTMKDAILKKSEDQANLQLGSYVSVIGDIFIDSLRGIRMVSAFECNVTSPEREIVWLNELYYLYENFYLWKRVE